MDRLHVATLNILNLADRWPERLPLILADMAALQPDVLGLQERVESARLAFDRPDPEDPTLYPSDHLGISARLEIG
jgi:endonuclease/exonuclease/phosphatase family metal-dependent hydrolase